MTPVLDPTYAYEAQRNRDFVRHDLVGSSTRCGRVPEGWPTAEPSPQGKSKVVGLWDCYYCFMEAN